MTSMHLVSGHCIHQHICGLAQAAAPQRKAQPLQRKVKLVHQRSKRQRVRAVENETDLSEEELEQQMEDFMRSQADRESGGSVASPDALPDKVIGGNEVSEEQAKKLCRDIMRAVNQLRDKRDMSVNECKLTVAIEDPRSRERKEALGIEENAGGVSRDEMAAALMDVVDGRIPKDRIALRELYNEIINWPWLDADEDQTEGPGEATANYEGITPTGTTPSTSTTERSNNPPRRPIGRDKSEAPQGLADLLPDWVGWSFLYGLSALPVIIGILVVTILFLNSLK